MDFFPLPDGPARIAQADRLTSAVLELASAIEQQVEEHIGLTGQYVSANRNAVATALGKKVKSATAKVLKPSDAAATAVSDAHAQVQSALDEHVATVQAATAGQTGLPPPPGGARISIGEVSGGSDSVAVGAGQPPKVIGINPGGHCDKAAFPVHLMGLDIPGGAWFYVVGNEGAWLAYGFAPPDFNEQCWDVYGPFPDLPAVQEVAPNVPFWDPIQALPGQPGGVTGLPPVGQPVGGLPGSIPPFPAGGQPPYVPPFPPGTSPPPPGSPQTPPTGQPPSTVPLTPPAGSQPPQPPYYPPGQNAPPGFPRLPPGVTGPPVDGPGGLPGVPKPPGSPPGGQYPPAVGVSPPSTPGGIVPPGAFSPVLVGYLPTPLQVAGNGVITVYSPIYGPMAGPSDSLLGGSAGNIGPPSYLPPSSMSPGGVAVGGADSSSGDGTPLPPFPPFAGIPVAGPPGCPPPTVTCPAPVVNVACGPGGGAGGGAGAPVDEQPVSGGRNIAVDPFADELPDEIMGGCKPLGVLLLPFPGDPKFCEKMVPIVNFLRKVGAIILGPIPVVFDIPDEADDAMSWVMRAINFITKWGGTILKNAFKIWWGAQKGLRNCDWCALLGLDVVRWIISTLRRVTVGASVLVKLEFALGVDDYRVDSLLRMVENYICPDRTWTFAQVIMADNNGACWSPEDRDCRYRAVGVDKERWRPFIEAAGKHLSAHEHILNARLEGLTPAQQRERMQCYGWRNAVDLVGLFQMYDRPPNPPEMLAWATNAITLTDFVADYKLDSEFYERMWLPYGDTLKAHGVLESIARNQWSHSQKLPSPSVLRDSLARLRPGRVDPANEFKTLDYMRHLAAEGIPPYWRGRLWTMTGKVLAPGQVANLLYWGIIDTKEAGERLQDSAYTAADAKRLQEAMNYDLRHRNASQIGGWTMPLAAHMRMLGVISEQAYQDRYSHLGHNETDAAEALEVARVKALAHGPESAVARAAVEPLNGIMEGLRAGVMDQDTAIKQYIAFGVPGPAAASLVNAEMYQAGVRRAKQAEMFLRRAYIRGRLSDAEATKRLLLLGFVTPYVDAIVQLWKVDLLTGPKSLTEGQVISAYKNAVIDRATALDRLKNLGWRGSEADLRLATVDAGAEPKPLKSKRRRPPPEEGSATLAKGDVKNLYVDGVIDDGIAAHLLHAIGYDPGAYELLLADWRAAREKKAGKAAGKQEPPAAPDEESGQLAGG